MLHTPFTNGGQAADDPTATSATDTSDWSPRQFAEASKRTEDALKRSRPKDYRRRNSYGEQFEGRPVRMLESPAYRVLSLSGHRVLSRIEIELAHHAGHDNGELIVSYQQFVDYGIERHAIAPAIRECVALGFLAVTERGRAGNREHRSPNKYRLTYRHAGRAKPTHEWAHIRTIGDAELSARMARRPTAKPRRAKTFSSAGKPTGFGAGNPHRKTSFSVRENPPSSSAGNPHYFLDSRGDGSPSPFSRPAPMRPEGTAADARVVEVPMLPLEVFPFAVQVRLREHQAASARVRGENTDGCCR
jgi:hypothetical protein